MQINACHLSILLVLVVRIGSSVPAAEPDVTSPAKESSAAESSTRRSSINPLAAALRTPAGGRVDSHGDPMPAGMIQRFGSARFKSTGWWRRMAFAGNDEWIWLKSDSRVEALHRETGRVVHHDQLRLGPGNVSVIAASSDGRYVAIGLWDRVPGEQQESSYRVVVLSARTTGHLHDFQWKSRPSDVRCLTFSGDGRTLLAADSAGRVQFWNLETGEQISDRQFEQGDYRDAALSPDGKTAILAGRQSIHWRIDSPAKAVALAKQEATAACFASNGKQFATVSRDGIHLWDAVSAQLIANLQASSSYSDVDFGIAYSPDSRFLAVPVVRENLVELWDVERRARVATMPVFEVRGSVISSDGRWLAASGGDSVISIFDIQSRERVSRTHGHSNPASAIRFLNNGRIVTAAEGEAIVWDGTTGTMQHRLEHKQGKRVAEIAISPNGASIVTSALDDTVRVWDTSTGDQQLVLRGHSEYGGMRSVQFVPDGSRFASWGDDSILRWWDSREGSLVGERAIRIEGAPDRKDDRFGDFALRGKLAPGASALYVRFRNELIDFDPRTAARRQSVTTRIDPYSMAVSADGRWIAGGEAVQDASNQFVGTNIVLFDTATLKTAYRWQVSDGIELSQLVQVPEDASSLNEHESADPWRTRAIGFSPDSSKLAWVRMTESRSAVDVVDLAEQRYVTRFSIDSPGFALDFSPDGRKLAIGHNDTTASLWSLPELSNP